MSRFSVCFQSWWTKTRTPSGIRRRWPRFPTRAWTSVSPRWARRTWRSDVCQLLPAFSKQPLPALGSFHGRLFQRTLLLWFEESCTTDRIYIFGVTYVFQHGSGSSLAKQRSKSVSRKKELASTNVNIWWQWRVCRPASPRGHGRGNWSHHWVLYYVSRGRLLTWHGSVSSVFLH